HPLAMTMTLPAMILALADGMEIQPLLQSRTHAPGKPSTTERVCTPLLLTSSQGMSTPKSAGQGRHHPQSPPMPTPQLAPLLGEKVKVERESQPPRPSSRRPASLALR